MTRTRTLVAITMILMAAPAHSGQRGGEPGQHAPDAANPIATEKLVAAILGQTYAFAKTWNTGRVDDYIANYEQSEAFGLYYSGGQQVGIEAARNLYYTAWPTEHAMGKFEVFDVKARILSSTTALSHGLFQHRFPDKIVNGNFTMVWILDADNTWKIAHEHSARISVEEPK